MLVRTLCRLAAAAPRRTLLARAPVALTPARAAAAVHLLSRHGYATKSSATESTDTVKNAVKKAVKAKATGKATSKAAPKKAKKKAAPKKAKKAAPKKAAPRTKKELTPEEEYKKKYYALRSTALLKDQPMGERTLSTHSVFIGDFLKGNENATSQMGAANEKFRNLTPAEREVSLPATILSNLPLTCLALEPRCPAAEGSPCRRSPRLGRVSYARSNSGSQQCALEDAQHA
jgi:hypothetical protein